MRSVEDFDDDGNWEVVYDEGMANAEAQADPSFTTVNLPTITVRHLLTEEQMISKDPYFVAMDDAEVREGIYEFLQDSERVDSFVRGWKEALAGLRPRDVPAAVRLWVAAEYKDMPEPADILREAARIAGIQSLSQRVTEWHRLYFPLAPAPAGLLPRHVFDEKTQVFFGSDVPAAIPILPEDASAAMLPVKGYAVRPAPVEVRQMTLGDVLAAPRKVQDAVDEPPRAFVPAEARKWRRVVARAAAEHRRAVFANWVHGLEQSGEGSASLPNTRAMAVSLAARGIDWDSLTPRELEAVRKACAALEEGAPKPRPAAAKRPKAPVGADLPTPFAPMDPHIAALRTFVEKKKDALKAFLRKLGRMREQQPAPAVMMPPAYNPLSLFEAISGAEGDPTQLMEEFRDYESELRRTADKAFMDAAAFWEAATGAVADGDDGDDGAGAADTEAGASDTEAAIAAFLADMDAIAARIRMCEDSGRLTNDFSGIPLYADMKQIKAGRDLAHYSGQLGDAVDLVAEAKAGNGPAADADAEDDAVDWATVWEGEPPEPMTLADVPAPAPEADGEGADPEAADATPGQAEVLRILVPILAAIARRTRLPFDRDQLALAILPHLRWASRRTLLLQGLPNVAEADINAFLQNETYTDAFVETYAQEQQRGLIRRVVNEVQASFKKVLYDALDLSFAWWATTLQDAFAEHRLLDYVPPEGTCTAFWGFHGPPMTNTQGRGVLMYLLCNFQVETMGAGAFLDYLGAGQRGPEGRVATIAGVANSLLPDHVARIKAAYAGLVPFFLKQKEALKEEQAVLRRLFGDGRALHKYVSALLQLPKWTAMQQTVLRRGAARGCCAQPLDASYRAYGNWDSKLLKPLVGEMKAFQAKGGVRPNALWAVVRPAMVEAPTKEAKEAKKAAATACHAATQEASVPLEPATYEALRPRLAPWVQGPPKAAGARLQLLAKQVAGVAASAATAWLSKLDVASADELTALATRLLMVFASTPRASTPRQLAHWQAARDALLEARQLLAAADEQAILADAKAIVTAIAILPRESSGDGAAWSLPEDARHLAAGEAHGAAVQVLTAFAPQLDKSAAYLQDHINELREQQKAKLLRELNSRDTEMRSLLTQMGRIGLVKLSDPKLPGKPPGAADDDAFGGLEFRGLEGDGGEAGDDEGADEEGYTDAYRGLDADGNEDELD